MKTNKVEVLIREAGLNFLGWDPTYAFALIEGPYQGALPARLNAATDEGAIREALATMKSRALTWDGPNG